MAKPVDVELTIISAKDLKNVNWHEGDLRPYAVAWVDPEFKFSTRVDPEGDEKPYWNEKLTVPVAKPLQDAELHIDIVHDKPSEGTKPLVGTVRVPLTEVVDEVGFDKNQQRTLKLKRPSGRPQGKLEVAIRLREKRWPEPYGTREYAPSPQGYPQNYSPYPSQQYPYGNPPTGYPNTYGNPYPQEAPYGGGNYSSGGGSYGSGSALPEGAYSQAEKPKSSSKYGLGTGLAVGAVAGVLGGVALAEGADYLGDKIADDAAEKVEEDLGANYEYYDGDE